MVSHDIRNRSCKHSRNTKTKLLYQHIATIVPAEWDWSRDGRDFESVPSHWYYGIMIITYCSLLAC